MERIYTSVLFGIAMMLETLAKALDAILSVVRRMQISLYDEIASLYEEQQPR